MSLRKFNWIIDWAIENIRKREKNDIKIASLKSCTCYQQVFGLIFGELHPRWEELGSIPKVDIIERTQPFCLCCPNEISLRLDCYIDRRGKPMTLPKQKNCTCCSKLKCQRECVLLIIISLFPSLINRKALQYLNLNSSLYERLTL